MTPIQSVSSVASLESRIPGLSPELSIVVPLYCEESNVDPLFERLETVVRNLDVSYEIICVDDSS